MPDKSNWLQDAKDSMQQRGTIGSFKSAAKQKGMSTMSFARQTKSSTTANPSMKKKANFAINASQK